MIQTLKSYFIKTMFAVALLSPFAITATVNAADIGDNLCKGANLSTTATTGCDSATAGDTVNGLITNVINIFSLVVGVVAVIMIIIGGLKYITSSGDSNNISSAKNTILYAIIGLVVVALAQIIVRFVLSKATEGAQV